MKIYEKIFTDLEEIDKWILTKQGMEYKDIINIQKDGDKYIVFYWDEE